MPVQPTRPLGLYSDAWEGEHFLSYTHCCASSTGVSHLIARCPYWRRRMVMPGTAVLKCFTEHRLVFPCAACDVAYLYRSVQQRYGVCMRYIPPFGCWNPPAHPSVVCFASALPVLYLCLALISLILLIRYTLPLLCFAFGCALLSLRF